jgi:hypothetical protein
LISLVRFAAFELAAVKVASLAVVFEHLSRASFIITLALILLVLARRKNATLLREHQLGVGFILLGHFDSFRGRGESYSLHML